MKKIYELAALGLGLAGLIVTDDSQKYESKLKEMAEDQVRNYQDGETTYRAGIDFMTNAPKFWLRNGEKPDQRSQELVSELLSNLTPVSKYRDVDDGHYTKSPIQRIHVLYEIE